MSSKSEYPAPPSPRDSWVLQTEERLPWLRAYLGNGRLAVQLVAEGGLVRGCGAPLHLMAELYDRAPSREVEHPVALPDWSSLRLSVNGRDLDSDAAIVYRQTLDLRAGLAMTRYAWLLDGIRLEAEFTLAVLRHEPNLALVRCTVQADRPCTVAVCKTLDPVGLPGLHDGQATAADGLIAAQARTRERGMPVAIAGTLIPPADIAGSLITAQEPTTGVQAAWAAQWFTDRSPEIAAPPVGEPVETFNARAVMRCGLSLQPGRPQTVTWLVAVHSGHTAADPIASAYADLERGVAQGAEQLLAAHRAAWEALWSADMQIEGADEVQRFVRAGLFALRCSLRAGVASSIAPMGLSSMGYNGHIFWDADTWMFPPLLLLHPDLAHSIVAYRQDRLPAARARAQAEGYAGAMFPWESAADGNETTPVSIARTGLREHHVTACVALAQWQYFLLTGDTAWLAERAWPVLEDVARFWVSRVTPDGHDGFEIIDVIAADEYAEDVDNDAFTNGAARAALLAAVAAARILSLVAPPEWQLVADGLVLRRDGDLVLEFDGYDGRMIKQADVELLTFPLEYPLSEASITKNLETYRAATDPDGPAMGRSISAVVAAQLGRREAALDLFLSSYRPHLWGPFYSLAETPTNGVVDFLTGVGGALQSLLFGFAGIRLHEECLAVDPLLPPGWSALRFPAIQWRGQTFSVAIIPGDGCEIGFTAAGIPCTLILRRWRPGPDPLSVALRAPEPCRCVLSARDWAVTPIQPDRGWLLTPPPSGPIAPFAQLRLTIRTEQGAEAAFQIEQRVRSGDD